MNGILLAIFAVFALFAKSTAVTTCDSCSCYRMFSATPTFCFTGNNCAGGGASGVPDDLKQVIVDRINHHRSITAKGQIAGIPGAKGMPSMVYDDAIAITAQRYVNKCSSKSHDETEDRYDPRGYIGQNGAQKGVALSGLTAAVAKELIDEWAKESKHVVGNTGLLSYYKKATDPLKVHGHYAQLVLDKAWRVGCGFSVSTTDDRSRFYCNFLEGTLSKKPVYAIAQSESEICQSCPRGTHCNTETKLCDPDAGNTNGPQWRVEKTGLDCSPADDQCATIDSGSESKISKESTFEDEYLHITLNKNEEASFSLPLSGPNGMVTEYRFGNLDTNQHPEVVKPVIKLEWTFTPTQIYTFPVKLVDDPIMWTKATFGFAVECPVRYIVSNPNDAPMYIDIRRVSKKD